jgi:WG containing repeat
VPLCFGQDCPADQVFHAKLSFYDPTPPKGSVIHPLFEDAIPFAEGLAAVSFNGRWGYINKSGEMRIPNHYPFLAEAFRGGFALVGNPVDGSELYINQEGKPQFFKSRKAIQKERTGQGYALCSLQLDSAPPNADVYLIPAYIWDQG